ncbi:MAG: ABC transporter ATP-binding protein [Clostridia bacterium]|nr:ABC transporter ATP-binding protein [Clostridia bacterium]
MEILKASEILKAYSKPVLKGASLTVSQNECIGIVGRNGCGKSTLLAILSGGIKADGGNVSICCEDAFADRRVFSKYVGYMPQNDPLIEELSVKDNLKLWYSIAKRPLDNSIIEKMGLKEVLNKRVSTLSGGMKRRVNMAGALASGSRLLILDEPSTGLDILCRQEMNELYRAYTNDGGAIIMATHSREEMDICTRLLLLDDGVLKEIDSRISMDELANMMK